MHMQIRHPQRQLKVPGRGVIRSHCRRKSGSPKDKTFNNIKLRALRLLDKCVTSLVENELVRKLQEECKVAQEIVRQALWDLCAHNRIRRVGNDRLKLNRREKKTVKAEQRPTEPADGWIDKALAANAAAAT